MDHTFEDTIMPLTTLRSGAGSEVASDVYGFTVQIVNVCFVGLPDGRDGWVLVDAGMPNSADAIIGEAESRFGARAPEAIILTHGHFDHVGAITDLIRHWGVRVYAHREELPFLTGEADYPPADSEVGGGLVAAMSPLFPNAGIDLRPHVLGLPDNGEVPHMPGWRWVHTPGHTPGHISLFREEDRFLIAGDAFVTVKQESLYKVIVQEPEISGPPKYFTTDWKAAGLSVAKLAALKPRAAVTGHGLPMAGSELESGLATLTNHFNETAVPKSGRYVH